jgi:AraC-like DNA-binding protein
MKKFFTHEDPIVPVHHPRVLFETAAAQGADRVALLENVGVTAETLSNPDVRISYVQFATLVHNALTLTENPELGLDFGDSIHLSHMGVLGLALGSSADVAAAFDVGLRYYRGLAPAWDLQLHVAGAVATLTAREVIPLSPFRVFATEALIGAIDRLGQHLIGQRARANQVRLHYSKPAHGARYEARVGGPVLFDQKVTQIDFEAALLRQPIAGYDPATARLAAQYCDTRLSPPAQIDGLVGQVCRILGGVSGHHPNLEELAAALQTSSRSLRRSLQRMGTSYQLLLDKVRRNRAEEWIRTTPMTVEEMAQQLGFSDVRSFRRAFKRWTGHTPYMFRVSEGKP